MSTFPTSEARRVRAEGERHAEGYCPLPIFRLAEKSADLPGKPKLQHSDCPSFIPGVGHLAPGPVDPAKFGLLDQIWPPMSPNNLPEAQSERMRGLIYRENPPKLAEIQPILSYIRPKLTPVGLALTESSSKLARFSQFWRTFAGPPTPFLKGDFKTSKFPMR